MSIVIATATPTVAYQLLSKSLYSPASMPKSCGYSRPHRTGHGMQLVRLSSWSEGRLLSRLGAVLKLCLHGTVLSGLIIHQECVVRSGEP